MAYDAYSAPAPSAERLYHLRRRLELAVETAIAALDALDAETEDREDGHDQEMDRADYEPDAGDLPACRYADDHDQREPLLFWG